MKKYQNKQGINHNGKDFNLDYTPYEYPKDKETIFDEIKNAEIKFSKYDKELHSSIYYYNIPASFDIETTSTYDENGEKIAFMYVWQFSINGKVIIGRTWEQFISLLTDLHEYTTITKRLIVYVHNLSFEFSFMQRWIEWYRTFCVKVREPIYAISTYGIEFRDSYILTGKSLEQVAKKDLLKYKVNKLVGNLDYSKIRGCETPLTKEELDYCINDCLILDALIQEKIENEGDITKIPLTKTGYVRKFLKKKCYPQKYGKKSREKEKYKNLMSKLTIDPEDYSMLKRAFIGGFTHANYLYVGKTIKGTIDSFDFTSSYPAVMLSEKFPMSKAEKIENVSRETFKELLKSKLLIFDIRFNNVREKENVYENYISRSKCDGKNIVENNGRVVSADWISTTITNIDFEIIKNFYDYDTIQVGKILAYEKAYLPKPIIEGVLELYEAKTTLKGVEGEEVEYGIKKEMLNSCYGCCVTDPVKPLVQYEGDTWTIEELNYDEAIKKYNSSMNRFLYYPWGIFITAYARRNLFMGIQNFGIDYIYSDTDSIKCRNAETHIDFINWYNSIITYKVKECLKFYDIDTSRSEPKTVKNEPKPIGVWDCETENAKYTIFKTLGAKRYIYTQNEELHITIAGLSKKTGAHFISIQDSPYEFFSDEMTVDADNTGKLLHTYIDYETKGNIIDHRGVSMKYHEMTSQHLEKTGYTLSLSGQFKQYLEGRRESWQMVV